VVVITTGCVRQHLTKPSDASGKDENTAEDANPGAGDEAGGAESAAEGQNDGPVGGRGQVNHFAMRGLRFVVDSICHIQRPTM
jgi:hypothetical protein